MGNIVPERVLDARGENGPYRWKRYAVTDSEGNSSGLPVISLEDPSTGVRLKTISPNPDVRVAAYRAWAGARHSRSPGTAEEIICEMGQKGVDPDQKLDATFTGYGHASVGDMARFEVHFDNTPSHAALVMFYLGSINSGQEKSTRYQRQFGDKAVHSLSHYIPSEVLDEERRAIDGLEMQANTLGREAVELFREAKERSEKAFSEFYSPTDKREEGSLASRALDTARFALPFGQYTGFVFETSARDWSRKIAHLRSMGIPFYQKLGDHLQELLSPPREIENALGFKAEAPTLIKHADPDYTVRDNLSLLEGYLAGSDLEQACGRSHDGTRVRSQEALMIPREYSETERMVAQYVTALRGDLEPLDVLEWVHSRSDEEKGQISRIIYRDHNRHREMPAIAETTSLGFIMQCQLGEVRDFNRHRAQGRHLQGWPMLWGLPLQAARAEAMLGQGYGLPLYLADVPAFEGLAEWFKGEIERHYEGVHDLFRNARGILGEGADYSFLLNVLPLAHSQALWMHSDPKQEVYFNDLRMGEGGHINYRLLAYERHLLAAASDPLLSGMQTRCPRPDPASREEFYSRK